MLEVFREVYMSKRPSPWGSFRRDAIERLIGEEDGSRTGSALPTTAWVCTITRLG